MNNVAGDDVIISEVHATCAALMYEIQLYNLTTDVIIEKTGAAASPKVGGVVVEVPDGSAEGLLVIGC